MNELMMSDLEKWRRIMQSGERGGLRLTAPECYYLLVLLESAHEELLNLSTQNQILRRTVDVLDPEGGRRRMELQCSDGAAGYEERTEGAYGRSQETKGNAGKSVFRNL